VKAAKVALQHNIGLGGAAVVGMYRLGFPEKFKPYPSNKKNYAVDSGDSSQQETKAASPQTNFKSAIIFETLSKMIKENPKLLTSVAGVFQFDITDGPNGASQSWVADVKNPPGSVKVGKNSQPGGVIIQISDENFVGLMTGTASAQKLMMSGELKLEGEMTLAMKLRELQVVSKPKL